MHILKLGGYVIRQNTEKERLVIQAKEISKSKVIIDPEWEGSHHE